MNSQDKIQEILKNKRGKRCKYQKASNPNYIPIFEGLEIEKTTLINLLSKSSTLEKINFYGMKPSAASILKIMLKDNYPNEFSSFKNTKKPEEMENFFSSLYNRINSSICGQDFSSLLKTLNLAQSLGAWIINHFNSSTVAEQLQKIVAEIQKVAKENFHTPVINRFVLMKKYLCNNIASLENLPKVFRNQINDEIINTTTESVLVHFHKKINFDFSKIIKPSKGSGKIARSLKRKKLLSRKAEFVEDPAILNLPEEVTFSLHWKGNEDLPKFTIKKDRKSLLEKDNALNLCAAESNDFTEEGYIPRYARNSFLLFPTTLSNTSSPKNADMFDNYKNDSNLGLNAYRNKPYGLEDGPPTTTKALKQSGYNSKYAYKDYNYDSSNSETNSENDGQDECCYGWKGYGK